MAESTDQIRQPAEGAEPGKWQQHLTLQLPAAKPGAIWVHACSVGEVGSVSPLIRKLLDQGFHVHLTVVTATGYAHAQRLLNGRASVSFLPWDIPGTMARLVNRLQPALLLLAETEFWPSMLAACHKRNIPVIGINTRISDRSFPRYRASRWLWKRWLAPVSQFLAQSEIDCERLIAMGVDPDRVQSVGNLKYAITAPEVDAAQIRRYVDPTSERPILLIASTHEKEDEMLLDMWPVWHATCPQLLTVLVPRHPQRFEQVSALIQARGLKLQRWSEIDHERKPDFQADIVLVDAMGELGKLYTVADAVIVAGSLTNIGGHNPLEAAICGRGVVTGPYIQNFRDMMKAMQKEQAAIVAESTNGLEKAVSQLLSHPDQLQQLNANAALFISDKSGVLDRITAAIAPWLAAVEKQP